MEKFLKKWMSIILVIATVFSLFAIASCKKPSDKEPLPGESSSVSIPDDSSGDLPTPPTWVDSDGDITIYPAPQAVTLLEKKKFVYDGTYYYDAGMENNAKNKLTKVLETHFGNSAFTENAGLIFENNTELNESGYTITVNNEGIKVEYNNGEGAYYAAVTLNQLFKQKPDGIPYIKIEDYPDMKMRGYHISSQNRVGKVETYKNIIDELAALKMNLLELAVFRPSSIQIDTFAPITQSEHGLTVEQCNEIVAYGKENYVQVVPYMETFGHMDELLRYPQFVDLRNTFTPGCATLSIYDPAVHEFLESYMDDMVKCFDPEFVTIGGDEVSGILSGKNQENVPAGATELDIFIYYMDLMYEMCEERGLEMFVCYDVLDRLYASGRKPLKEMFERMPNCTVIIWQYEEDSTFVDACNRFDKLGAKYVIMPSTNSFSSLAGRLTTAEKNITRGAGIAIERNTGVITGMFGDGGTRNTWTNEFSALTYAGGCCWNYNDNVNKTNEYLAYTNEYIYGESTGKLCEAWTKLQRHNDLLSRSWGLAWLSYIGNNGFEPNAALDLYLSFQKETGKEKYTVSIEKMEEIRRLAQNVLDTLETVTLTGKYAVQVREEMKITAKQMVVLSEYAKMLLQLQGEIKTEAELKEKAAEMYEYAYNMANEFRETWYITSNHGVIEDTIAWLNIPMGLFGSVGKVFDISDENLFYLTPDKLVELDEKQFNKGYIWFRFGNAKNYPTISIANAVYSYNDIQAMIDDGSIKLREQMNGVEGKVFEVDNKKLLENYHYNFYYASAAKEKLSALFYWPSLLKGTGRYQLTAKVKYESGRTVNASSVVVSGSASADALRTIQGATVTYSTPDQNGWVTVTYTFENTDNYDCTCFGVNSKPELFEDTMYLAELKLVKIN